MVISCFSSLKFVIIVLFSSFIFIFSIQAFGIANFVLILLELDLLKIIFNNLFCFPVANSLFCVIVILLYFLRGRCE